MLTKTKQIRLRAIAMAISAIALPALSLSAFAAGLGRITVQSALGEPLKAQLEITGTRDELASAAAKLASSEAFRAAGVEYAPALASLKFSSRLKEDAGRQFIEISTDRPLNEPFIDMLVELSWSSGRLVREYTFLLDPPELMAQRSPAPAIAVGPTVQSASAQLSPAAAEERPAASASSPARPTVPVPLAPLRTKELTGGAADFGQRPAPSVASGDVTHEVRRGDTLSEIAAQTRPADVSLDQMLVALFQSNADAFDGNMNRLRAGKILRIPDAETVRGIDAMTARKEVTTQFADFDSYRNKLAGKAAQAPARKDMTEQAAAGKVTPKVAEKAPPVAAGSDKLSVSKSESTKAAPDPAVKGRLSALEEDLVSRDRALKDANSRIADLEKNLGDLKKLAELKSQAGAALQKSAEAAKPVKTPGADAKPAVPEVAKEQTPVVTKEVAKPAAPVAVEPVAEPAKPAAVAQAEVVPPKPKNVVPPPEPEPESDFIEENAPLLAGGAGVLALLAGYFGFAAYRRKKAAKANADEVPLTQSSLTANSVFGDASVAASASAISSGDLSIAESLAATGNEVVDPIVEADTYLAFGKDAQAEEILLDALRVDPARLEVHLKLLEIYAARRAVLQFNTLAEDLRQQTGARGAEWERAREMGQSLDPNNALYHEQQAPVAAPVVVDDHQATMVFSAPPTISAESAPAPAKLASSGPELSTAPAADEPVALDFDLELSEPVAVMAEAGAPVEETTAPDAGAGLDFDLDLGTNDSATPPLAAVDEPQNAEEPVAESAVPAAVEEKAMALDFDFDLELPAAEVSEPVAVSPSTLELDVETDSATTESAAAPSLDLPVLDLPAAAEPAVEPSREAAGGDGNSVDFDFDLELPSVSEPPQVDEQLTDSAGRTEPSLVEPPSIELPAIGAPTIANEIDFDIDAGALDQPAAAPPGGSALDLEGVTTDEPPAAATTEDNPEAATKLELALAYEEMGDRDGARELLEEVLAEGSPAQQAKAREKLAALG